MKTRLLGALLLAASAAFAGDSEFERIVKAIETRYGAKPMHIPFLGMASFIVKVAHPEGASGFKLAVFEDLKSDGSDWRDRDRFMAGIPGSGLSPMVQVHSRRNGEATYIFMDPESRSARILIATFERNEATVIEVKADAEKLLRSLREPDRARHNLSE